MIALVYRHFWDGGTLLERLSENTGGLINVGLKSQFFSANFCCICKLPSSELAEL
jgi:hypothetical protein